MSRSRMVHIWTPDRVDDAPVASHRYLWSGAVDAQGNELKDVDQVDYHETRKNIPYAVGEVIFTKYNDQPVKARIVAVLLERDHTGSRREFYRAQLATVKGLWSKLWINVYPGQIQRGYMLAGLAPDLPEDI